MHNQVLVWQLPRIRVNGLFDAIHLINELFQDSIATFRELVGLKTSES